MNGNVETVKKWKCKGNKMIFLLMINELSSSFWVRLITKPYHAMVYTLYGSSDNVAHVWSQIGLF